MIIVVVVRRAGLCELREERGIRLTSNVALLPIRHPFRAGPGRSAQDMGHQCWERHLTFTHDHMVDERKGAKVFQPHLAVIVGATEHDLHVRIQILDELRHGQTGHVLIEGGREPHDLVLAPIDAGHGSGQELRRGPRGHLLEERNWLAALPGNLLEHRLEHPRILGPFGVVAKQQIGEEPLAEQRAFLANRFVERNPDLVRESHIEVMTLDPDALRFQQRRQRAQLNGRILRKTEGHVDERHLGLGATHKIPSPAGTRRGPNPEKSWTSSRDSRDRSSPRAPAERTTQAYSPQSVEEAERERPRRARGSAVAVDAP